MEKQGDLQDWLKHNTVKLYEKGGSKTIIASFFPKKCKAIYN